MSGSMIVFENNGELDMRALTVFGMSAKPKTDSPIGYFGTGLKYAIAVLVRNGCPVTIFVGKKKYSFYVKNENFRGSEYGTICYTRDGMMGAFDRDTLPFTTEHGKNWELWQAFRELESNTRDEQGRSFQAPKDDIIEGEPGKTKIVVVGDKFAEEWFKMDKVFLPNGISVRKDASDFVQVLNQPSDHIYYRGLRVMDLKKPSHYTYNILERIDLTEDRTVKYPHEVQSIVGRWVATKANEQQISIVVGLQKPANEDKFWESKLDLDYVYSSPSETFLTVMNKKKSRGHIIPSGFTGYFGRYAPPLPVPTKKDDICDKLLRWIDSGEIAGHVGLVDVLRDAIREIQTLRDGQAPKSNADEIQF